MTKRQQAIFQLHLNGGPRDDAYIEHWMSTLEVAIIRGGLSAILDPSPNSTMQPYKTGVYRIRLDDNGDPVPHNLQGFAEADWQGW